MSEEPQQPDAEEPLEAAAPGHDAPRPRRRGRKRRALRRLLGVLLAIVVGSLVALLTVDLGPQVRDRAEREGSNYLKRPMHIGKVVARLVPGEFEFHDLVIEGLTPSDRPFLVAQKIAVRLPWWTAFSRRLIIESVTMTDWEMVIETFPSSPQYPNGRHNLPKFTPDPKPPGGKPVDFTTTLRSVLATRGKLIYEDHGTPWGIVAPNLTVQMYRSPLTNDYRGRASFSHGTVDILSYLPFRADMQSRFSMNGTKVHFDRMDLATDGAQS